MIGYVCRKLSVMNCQKHYVGNAVTFVSFCHFVSTYSSVLQQGMVFKKEMFFFIEEFVNVPLG